MDEQLTDTYEEAIQYSIIQPSLAIDSMRRNGYVTTDTAIAELIDNAVEARASNVEVLLFEDQVALSSGTNVSRIARIAVVDDGVGMSKNQLRTALRFGGGDRWGRNGIGRFGFGLPNSSISQADHAEVWSWQNGPGNALSTYLDVKEVESGVYVGVPAPVVKPIPDEVQTYSTTLAGSGTLVYWSNLDPNITWKKGKTVIEHTQFLVGRIYRYFLRNPTNPLRIRLVAISSDGEILEERDVTANDPLYLTTIPDLQWPGGDEPMFQPYGNVLPFTFTGTDGGEYQVEIRFSYSKPEARAMQGGKQAGNLPHGKHAVRNLGVSIVRADREMRLADIIHGERYLDRWWGVEISFPPQLDELFGVTNNKQDATYLVDALSKIDADTNRSVNKMVEDGEIDDTEETKQLYNMAQTIVFHVGSMMKLIRKQNPKSSTKGDSSAKRHGEESSPSGVNKRWERRGEEHPTQAEAEERQKPTKREQIKHSLLQSLREKGLPEKDAEEIIGYALDQDRRLIFVDSSPAFDGDELFRPDEQPGALVEIEFNVNHPAYSRIVSVLSDDTSNDTDEELRARIENASESLKMLFAAWVRMELEARAGNERRQVQRTRRDWGRMAYDFLEDT